MDTRLEKPIELKYAPLAPEVWNALGDLKRTGWVNRGVENPESVQEHIISLIEIAGSLENVLSVEEKDNLLDMLEVHDWPEATVGDQVILTLDETEFKALKAVKFEKEKAALASMCENLGDKGQEIMGLYLRFETSFDSAALFGRQLDKYQAVEKALEYERSQNIPLFKEFLDYARPKITHPILLKKIQELEEIFGNVL